MSTNHISRRDAIRSGLAAGLALGVGRLPVAAQLDRLVVAQDLPLITKKIPATGEMLPVVGIGTNRFGVSDAEAKPLCEVLRKLSDLGGRVVDTARAYGRSEEVIGQCVREIGNRDKLFIVTKHTINPRMPPADPKAGVEQAFARLQTDRIDLMMVHGMGGSETLLPLIFDLKKAGKLRYVGISGSTDQGYPRLAQYMRDHPLDFIQVDYSLGDRNSEEMILPLAQERGMAVIANVPFGGDGATVLQRVAGTPLPDWAKEFDATSWPQVLLKYIVSHPAITVVIPGTTKVSHAIDNHQASRGRLPDAAMRRRMEQFYDALRGP